MNFTLNDEQRMLAEMVGRWIEKDYSFETRKASLSAPGGFSAGQWALLAETGLLGLLIPEAYGGLGATPVETLIVMEALGRGLVVEPFVHHAVVATRLLSLAGNESQKHELLPRMASGQTLVAVAAQEAAGRFDLWHVETRATLQGNDWKLNGAKCTVPFGDSADVLVVSARTSGAITDKTGISLFLVDRSQPGMHAQGFKSFDGHRVAEIQLQDVVVPAAALLGTLDTGYVLLELTVDEGIAALCSEAVGAMQKLLELTGEYLQTRKQFGKPIGSFQALQHRAAEMVMSVEQARSAALMAAAHVREEDPLARRRGISAAKSMIGRFGRHVGETSTQLHGGMGMTDEAPGGHYYKRLIGIDKTWGDAEHHAELFEQTIA